MANRYDGKRIFYFDVLRAIAILCVIMCHTTNLYMPFKYTGLKIAIPGLLNVLNLVGIPLFFMLSGALLLNRTYSLEEFYKKRFTRILYPAVFWMLLTVMIFAAFLTTEDIPRFIFGEKYYTWFIWVMIGIYLITPVVNSYVKEYELKGVKLFLAIWLVTIILETVNHYPFKRLELSYYAGFLGYLVLGYYLANADFNISDKTMAVSGLVLFIISSALNMYIKYIGFTFKQQYLSIFVVLSAVGLFLFIKALCSYLDASKPKMSERIKNGKIGEIVFLVSAASYGMYFANSLILRFVKLLDVHSLKMIPVIFVAVSILSLIVILLLDKVPILKRFTGMA